MNPIFLGSIQKGKLTLNNQDGFDRWLIHLEGKSIEVVVRIPRKDRSSPENRYYWGIPVKIISDHTGYTPDEVHEFLKNKFLSKIIVMAGKDEKIARSSTELSTVEWEEWMTRIREWAAQELGLDIPDPKRVDYER